MLSCNFPHCQNGSSVGLETATYSGEWNGFQWIPEGNLKNSNNLHHVVTVRNLLSYRVDVDCTGTILASASRKLKFYSPVSTDSDMKWQDTCSLIAATPQHIDEHSFDHVQLLQFTGQGANAVDMEVTSKAPHRPSYTVTTRITVTVW